MIVIMMFVFIISSTHYQWRLALHFELTKSFLAKNDPGHLWVIRAQFQVAKKLPSLKLNIAGGPKGTQSKGSTILKLDDFALQKKNVQKRCQYLVIRKNYGAPACMCVHSLP